MENVFWQTRNVGVSKSFLGTKVFYASRAALEVYYLFGWLVVLKGLWKRDCIENSEKKKRRKKTYH